MATNQSPIDRSTHENGMVRIWRVMTRPHPSIQELGERRSAQLAISLILVIGLFTLVGFLTSSILNGLSESIGGFGASIIGLTAAYLLSRTRTYQSGVFLFSILFGASAYINIVRQGGGADISAVILVFVPLSLIVASTFLSSWAVSLLTGLNVAAIIFLQFFGIPLTNNIGGIAGIITTIGLVLILLGNFRKNTESLRLEEVRSINRELEDATANLEKRVEERTTELEQANRQTSHRAAQLQTITELSEAIAQFQDLNTLFPSTTCLISERFGFYHVGIFLLDSDGEHAILQAANSEGGQRMLARGHRLQLGTGVVGFAAKTGQPRIALDVGADAVFFDNPDLPETRSEAALPLISRGDTIGVLDVQSTAAGAFSNEDLQVLTTLANQVAIAFENARLLTEARAALTQVQEVYNEFTRAEWSRAVSLAEQSGFRYRAGRIELLEHGLRTAEIVSAVESGRVETNQVEGSKEKRARVAVPVKLRGEVIGILHVESNDPSKELHTDEIDLVEAVAERAAFAMENARLFQDARRRAAKEQLISEASAKIGSAFNLENILQTTAEELERVLGGSEVLIRFQNNREANE
jgi:GAF domain-containing protein